MIKPSKILSSRSLHSRAVILKLGEASESPGGFVKPGPTPSLPPTHPVCVSRAAVGLEVGLGSWCFQRMTLLLCAVLLCRPLTVDLLNPRNNLGGLGVRVG